MLTPVGSHLQTRGGMFDAVKCEFESAVSSTLHVRLLNTNHGDSKT